MTLARLRRTCLGLPRATSDFPFDEVTEVFRVEGKIFALVDTGQAPPLTVNLKCDPDLAADLRLAWPGEVLPGWHMNHRHWNTVRIGGSVPDEKLSWLVRHSWERVVAGLPAALRRELAPPQGAKG